MPEIPLTASGLARAGIESRTALQAMRLAGLKFKKIRPSKVIDWIESHPDFAASDFYGRKPLTFVELKRKYPEMDVEAVRALEERRRRLHLSE